MKVNKLDGTFVEIELDSDILVNKNNYAKEGYAVFLRDYTDDGIKILRFIGRTLDV